MLKRILCFGDSNTWGYNVSGGRYGEDERWPTLLQKKLGENFRVIEEGFNGRTTVFDDEIEGGYKSGLKYLPPCVMTHSPLDLVILMLGTNDLKKRFGMTAFTIGGGLTACIKAIRTYAMDAGGNPPPILLVCPPPVLDNVMETRHAPIFGADAPIVAKELPEELSRVAKLMRCEYLDAGKYAEVSPMDAVHLTLKGHRALADAMYDKVISII